MASKQKTFAIDSRTQAVPNWIYQMTISAARASRAIKQAERLLPGREIRARQIRSQHAA